MIERTIDVAGLGLRFVGSAADIAVVERRYSAFVGSADAPVEVRLDLHPLNASGPPVDEPFAVTTEGDDVIFAGAGVYAVVTPGRRSASIRGPRTERPIDAVMRYVLAAHLLERGGVLLHASAVVMEGRAWVVSGPSGAGKSTMGTTLDGELLCDEAVALLPHGDGVAAHATPYWTAQPGRAPVAGILFPDGRRGDDHAPAWRALSASQAVARLMPAIGPTLPRETPRALAVADALARAVPCAAITVPTISHIRHWLQPLLRGSPPTRGTEYGVSVS